MQMDATISSPNEKLCEIEKPPPLFCQLLSLANKGWGGLRLKNSIVSLYYTWDWARLFAYLG